MLEPFLKTFNITSKNILEDDKHLFASIPEKLLEFMSVFGGSTFNNGIYRIHSFASSLQWSIRLTEYFPDYKNQIFPFGFDWMSRQFCLNKDNKRIYMFDPATVEDFQLEKGLYEFHNEDIVGGVLADSLFREVLSFCRLKMLNYNECLGYKIPLFLNGKDVVANHEKLDLEVYWHLSTQIYNKIKNLPDGTRIDNIVLE